MSEKLQKNETDEINKIDQFRKEFHQDLLFYRESKKEQILMSDEQEVHVFYSLKHSNSSSPTIVFIQGIGPGIYSWSDLWDELYKSHNLVIIDSREKPTIDLKKKKQCTVKRIASDIKEVLHYLKIEDQKIVFIASSFGVFYAAHTVAQRWIKPKGCIFIGPFIEANYPKIKTSFAFMLPTFFLEKIGKHIATRFLSGKIAEGFQRKVYYERVASIDVKRWKYCSKMRFWNATEDFTKIDCPIIIFITADDKYHKEEGAEKVKKLVKNSVLEIIPNYNYMHIKPGVVEFTKKIKIIISNF